MVVFETGRDPLATRPPALTARSAPLYACWRALRRPCVSNMPLTEDGGEHQPRLGLPQGLKPDDRVFVIRFTGEVFKEYRWVLKTRGGVPRAPSRHHGASRPAAALSGAPDGQRRVNALCQPAGLPLRVADP